MSILSKREETSEYRDALARVRFRDFETKKGIVLLRNNFYNQNPEVSMMSSILLGRDSKDQNYLEKRAQVSMMKQEAKKLKRRSKKVQSMMQRANQERRDYIRNFEKSIKSVFQFQKESKRDLINC
jgi:hypothetical protein